MDSNDLKNRFEYHKPANELVALHHGRIRETLYDVALVIDDLCPDGREKSLAITKLEEAMFWANAAIARNPVPEPGADV